MVVDPYPELTDWDIYDNFLIEKNPFDPLVYKNYSSALRVSEYITLTMFTFFMLWLGYHFRNIEWK